MSRNEEILRAYFDEVYGKGNSIEAIISKLDNLLSENFQSTDKDGNITLERASYIGFARLLFNSFNDLKFIPSDIHAEGEAVIVNSHFEGTFTGDLDLSAMGMGVIPASGKKVVWPESLSKWKFAGGKVTSIQSLSTGGVAEFLELLGVKFPSA